MQFKPSSNICDVDAAVPQPFQRSSAHRPYIYDEESDLVLTIFEKFPINIPVYIYSS